MIKLKQLDTNVVTFYKNKMKPLINARLSKNNINRNNVCIKTMLKGNNFNDDFFYSLLTEKIFNDSYKYKSIIDEYLALVKSATSDIASKKKLKSLNKQIEKVINYDIIDAQTRHELLCKMDVNVCPYCNRQFISKYKTENGNKSTADLDHFYHKAQFALFALSLYNFVPACQTCNERLKGSKCDDILYPYDEEFGSDAIFIVNNKDNDFWLKALIGATAEVKIDISVKQNSAFNDKIINNNKIFKIKELYQSHNSYASMVLNKKYLYNTEYGDYLKKIIKEMSGAATEPSDEMMYNLFYGYTFEKDEPLMKILAKLTKDLVLTD